MQESTRLQLDFIPDNDPSLKLFDSSQKITLREVTNLLEFLLSRDYLDVSQIRGEVLNWGCSSGGESYIFRKNGANVTAIDEKPERIARLLKAEILPEDRAIVGDGIEYLGNTPDDTYGLITAFMFTTFSLNLRWYELLTNFYKESNRAIKPSGRILITSDGGTMGNIKKLLIGYGDYVDRRIESIFIGKKVNYLYFPSWDCWAREY